MEFKTKITKNLTDTILETLRKYPITRSSDRLLYIKVLDAYGLSGMRADELFNTLEAPCYESVGRIRRKIQKAYPDLCGSDNVEDIRMQHEMRFRAYARQKEVK